MTTIALLKFTLPFTDKKAKHHVPVVLIRQGEFDEWLKKQKPHVKKICEQTGFKAQPDRPAIVRNSGGEIESILVGIKAKCGVYDTASAIATIRTALTKDIIKAASFYFDGDTLKGIELENAHIGWGKANYTFDTFKPGGETAKLFWSKGVNKKRVMAVVESTHLVRNLVNAPANIMGPDEMEEAVRIVARKHKATVKTIHDQDLVKKNFPLVFAVGDGSDRRPRIIDLSWGDSKNPKVTLVGKGVAFDTGGLNLKPTSAMALMKKDMGGAAHVLALGNMIMAIGLPVRLRILIAAVENSVSGRAFRPGDIFKSRKGITIENTNTDAEGRLILADTLTYACEDKPKLIIDFATLTGSARAGLGPDIPPIFSNDDSLADSLKKLSFDVDDPVWPMPLWSPYKKLMDSPVADMVNSTNVPGDLIFSAVFLQQFLTGAPDWLHLDCYAWEQTGRPGRPRGGADTGLRAVFSLLEQRFKKKKSN